MDILKNFFNKFHDRIKNNKNDVNNWKIYTVLMGSLSIIIHFMLALLVRKGLYFSAFQSELIFLTICLFFKAIENYACVVSFLSKNDVLDPQCKIDKEQKNKNCIIISCIFLVCTGVLYALSLLLSLEVLADEINSCFMLIFTILLLLAGGYVSLQSVLERGESLC